MENLSNEELKYSKSENITFRIEKNLKETYAELCHKKDCTMSEDIMHHIKKEVELYRKHYVEEIISELLLKPNIEIINTPYYHYSGDNCCGNFMTEIYMGDIIELVDKNSNKEIKIYLKGCDIKNKLYRLVII